MKTIYKIILSFITFLFCDNLLAQPMHNHNIVKQQGIKGILKASTNAKIHANSNSVFGTANTHPNYSNKAQPKKDEMKVEKEMKKNNAGKKEKK